MYTNYLIIMGMYTKKNCTLQFLGVKSTIYINKQCMITIS